MLLAQDEIDAVLKSADAMLGQASGTSATSSGGSSAGSIGGRSGGNSSGPAPSPRLQRVLKLRIPLVVQLANRRIKVQDILKWSRGTIVEFNRSVETPLELLVSDIPIGRGEAVKVGENFGLRINSVVDAHARAASISGLSQ